MKISSLSTCLFVASAATSKNQAEAGLPSGRFAAPVARGLLTGAISAGVKNIVSGLQREVNEDARVESLDLNFSENGQYKTRRSPSAIVKKAMRNFPVNFGSNAIATACVDKMRGVTRKEAVKNLQQLALPVACMGITQEVLSDVQIPRQLKEILSYGAFLAGGVAQGKAPVSSGLAISGFVAGASLLKSFGKNGGAIDTQGVSESAASGFMAPKSSKTSDGAAAGSYDDYIRKRYGLKEDEKFWTGPDGSIFVPLSTP